MPATRAKQPVARKPARRRPRRRKRRSSGTRPSTAFFRAGAASILLVGLLYLVPPVRVSFAHARDVLVDAMAASRRAELRRLATARYALEYGVPLELASDIERAAVAEGIDPELAFRLVRVESEFRESAVSPVGALGLTQLMPATAASLQPGISEAQIFDRKTNLRLGFRYLRWLLEVYDGDVTEALHAYNRGPGTVDRLRSRGEDPANGYAERILRGSGTPRYTGNGLTE